MKSILDQSESDNKIFVITQTSSIDECTWDLVGKVQTYPKAVEKKMRKNCSPYCSDSVVRENMHNESWQIEDKIL